ncbi:MAG: hypothetical protein M0004_07045 [Actinomycetota bacterium]|nr:hypothetical protein [Actinomycetota bacterium]
MTDFAYVQAGYVVALGGLALYGASLIARERAARRRVPVPVPVRTDERRGEHEGGAAGS